MSEFPRLLLVSDLTLSVSQNGYFANPTLFNLFKHYPSELLLQIVPRSSFRASPPVLPHVNVLAYSDFFVPQLRNRVGLIVNNYFEKFNLNLLKLLPLYEKAKIEDFNPEIAQL